MPIPEPDHLFDRLAPALPAAPLWAWQTGAGVGLLAAAGAITFGQFWAGGILLLSGILAGGVGEALARRDGAAARPILLLGLMLIPFGFALVDPARALAAMFLMFALSVLTVLTRGYVSVVTWLIAAMFLLACMLPNFFSLLAYSIGVIAFIAAGQGAVRGRT